MQIERRIALGQAVSLHRYDARLSLVMGPSEEIGPDTSNPISLLPRMTESILGPMASRKVEDKSRFFGRRKKNQSTNITSMLNISSASSTLTGDEAPAIVPTQKEFKEGPEKELIEFQHFLQASSLIIGKHRHRS